MTDDEKAAAVQEALSGLRMCPRCGKSMERIHMSNDSMGKHVPGWFCDGQTRPPHQVAPGFSIGLSTHEVYMFDDGTEVKPPAGEDTITFMRERDVDLGPIAHFDTFKMNWPTE